MRCKPHARAEILHREGLGFTDGVMLWDYRAGTTDDVQSVCVGHEPGVHADVVTASHAHGPWVNATTLFSEPLKRYTINGIGCWG